MKNLPLPKGWQEVKLGDICSINVSSLKENTNENFKFKYIDLSAVKNGIIDFPNDYITFKNAPSRARRIIKIDDVIMATVRPNLKGFAYISFDPEEYICSTGFAVLTSKSEISMKYVYQNLYANYIEKQIFNMLVGSNYPALNTSDILNIKILLPPLDEQKR
ncbi:restriction endonuclease subunit S, partial [Brachyspira hampsonii]